MSPATYYTAESFENVLREQSECDKIIIGKSR